MAAPLTPRSRGTIYEAIGTPPLFLDVFEDAPDGVHIRIAHYVMVEKMAHLGGPVIIVLNVRVQTESKELTGLSFFPRP